MVKKKKSRKKKSYNPFKMWGSWVGAGLGLLMLIVAARLLQQPEWVYNLLIPLRPIIIMRGSDPIGLAIGMMIFGGLSNIIIGFLIGWGIHSLIRKLR